MAHRLELTEITVSNISSASATFITQFGIFNFFYKIYYGPDPSKINKRACLIQGTNVLRTISEAQKNLSTPRPQNITPCLRL
jgi:hypothetical protein